MVLPSTVPLACDTIELKPEVRQMCASDSCHKYNKCWSCPPGCGTLEECEKRVRKYKLGILVQTVGQLEDSMDGEGMMRIRGHAQGILLCIGKRPAEVLPGHAAYWSGMLYEV